MTPLPPSAEWHFNQVPEIDAEACFHYEAARERWKAGMDKPEFPRSQRLLALCDARQELMGFAYADIGVVNEISLQNSKAEPWLTLTAKRKAPWKRFVEAMAAYLGPIIAFTEEATSDYQERLHALLSINATTSLKSGNFKRVTMAINWSETDSNLLRAFHQFIRGQRKSLANAVDANAGPKPKIKSTGRPWCPLSHLTYLAMWRLRRFGLSTREIAQVLSEVRPPFAAPSRGTIERRCDALVRAVVLEIFGSQPPP